MILGALVSAGVDARELVARLALLDVAGYEVTFETVDRSGISATKAKVLTAHEHKHRHLSDILKIIGDSRLDEAVKTRASQIFTRLAEAEARVHNVALEKIHFHEVGALDAIVDVIGACIAFELLGIERFVSSPLHVGSGTVEMAHGRFPVPPPAVTELLRGVPIYSTEIKGELLTPTGAAIISTVCETYGVLPSMRVENTGYGAGTREYEKFPNVLRVMVGESHSETGVKREELNVEAHAETQNEIGQSREKLLMIETNLDDASPQVVGYLMEQAFERGALDCYLTPVQMKKNRPGVLISILCHPREREKMFALLFTETPTLGARVFEVERRSLPRKIVSVETEFGALDVKTAIMDGRVVNAKPEYEQCRAIAAAKHVPLRVVEDAVMAAFNLLGED